MKLSLSRGILAVLCGLGVGYLFSQTVNLPPNLKVPLTGTVTGGVITLLALATTIREVCRMLATLVGMAVGCVFSQKADLSPNLKVPLTGVVTGAVVLILGWGFRDRKATRTPVPSSQHKERTNSRGA